MVWSMTGFMGETGGLDKPYAMREPRERGTHGDQTKAVHFDCGQLGSRNVGTDQEEDPQNTRNANKTYVTSLLSRTGTCLSRTLPKTKARTEKLRSIVTRHNVTNLERAVQENANYRGGGDFARGIFRTRKFRAGFISHRGLKIEREISHLPGFHCTGQCTGRTIFGKKKNHHQGFA